MLLGWCIVLVAVYKLWGVYAAILVFGAVLMIYGLMGFAEEISVVELENKEDKSESG